MATFKYVGSKVKDNGKVDVKIRETEFLDVTPDTFTITVSDNSFEERALEQSKDVFDGTYNYIKQ